MSRRAITLPPAEVRWPAKELGSWVMPMFRRKPARVEAVQWTGDDEAWEAICDLHADTELVAFRDGAAVSIETTGGRVVAQPGDWIVKRGIDNISVCGPAEFGMEYEPHG